MKIGIYGNGKIGNATSLLFEGITDITSISYDIDEKRCCPTTTTLKEITDCDIIFICLPTPMKFNGACHTDIVDDAVSLLKGEHSKAHLVIRSTVLPGTSKRLGCHAMPYFGTEANWVTDTRETIDWLIGVNSDLKGAEAFKSELEGVLNQSEVIKGDVTCHFLTTEEVEVTKYTRNAFLATKVSFFNEVKNYCDKLGVDYNNVRRVVTQDQRIGESHSQVPGPDGKSGFGGKSLMKDLMAYCIAMESVGNSPLLLRPVLGRNARKDRPNENWHKPVKTLPITKESLDRQTISQLKSMCLQRRINTDNCVEKIELREKIIDHETQLQVKREEQERINSQGPIPGQVPSKIHGQVPGQVPSKIHGQVPGQANQPQMFGTVPGQANQPQMFGTVPGQGGGMASSFGDQLNAIRARQAQLAGMMQGQQPLGQQMEARSFPSQGYGVPQTREGGGATQFPHQFGFANYGNGRHHSTAGGPIQMNVTPPRGPVTQAQHPGPMSVQNGGIPINPPQYRPTTNQSQIGFNGGVQSTY